MDEDRLVLRTGCVVDLRRRVVEIDGRDQALSPREAALLRYLGARVGRDVSQDELHREVWGHAPSVVTRAAFRTIQRLKRKLEPDPSSPQHLVTVHGTGFRLVVDPIDAAPAFVGRADELRALADAAHHRLVTVCGLGGMGKTALVRASRLGGPWVQLGPATGDDDVVRAVAAALELPLGDVPLAQIGRALAARGPDVVVIDEAEHALAAVRTAISAWLDAAPAVRFLVTARTPVGWYGERLIALGPLPVPDAVRLWNVRTGDRGDAAEAQVRALDGIPLAIELVAARPPGDRAIAGGAAGPDTGEHRGDPVDAAIAWAWRGQPADAQRALTHATVVPASFTLELFEQVSDVVDPAEALAALLRSNLVSRAGDRFHLLDRIRRFAAGHLVDRDRIEARHGAAAASTDPATPDDLDGVIAACHRALARGDLALGWDAARRAIGTLVRRGPLAAAVAVAQAVADATPDPEVLAELGWLVHRAGDSDGGLARVEAAVARLGSGPHPGEAAILGRHAAILVDRGRAAEARPLLDRAESLAVARGDLELEGAILAQRAVLEGRHGPPDVAHARYAQALRVARRRRDRATEGTLLAHFAKLVARPGREAEARSLLDQALAAHREVGDRVAEAVVLGRIGAWAFRNHRPDEAAACYADALAIHRAVGDLRSTAIVLDATASILRNQGRGPEAEARYREALAIHRETRDRRGEAVAIGNLGVLRSDQGRAAEAIELFGALLGIYEAIDYPAGIGLALGYLAYAHAQQGDRAAEDLYRRAIAVHRTADNPRSEGIELGNLGEHHRAGGRTDLALPLLREALSIHRRCRNARFEGLVEVSLGAAQLDLGALDDAAAHAGAAGARFRSLGDPWGEGCARGLLAEVERRQGRLDRAALALDEADALLADGPRIERARVACVRARWCLDAGDRPGAAAALRDARSHPVPEGTEVARSIAAIAAALDP